MSKRQPSRTAVFEMPPTTSSASNTVAVTLRLESMYAAVRPAGPAPMMTIEGSLTIAAVYVRRSAGLHLWQPPLPHLHGTLRRKMDAVAEPQRGAVELVEPLPVGTYELTPVDHVDIGELVGHLVVDVVERGGSRRIGALGNRV